MPMNVLRHLREWPYGVSCGGVAIGVFDGVHLGHQAVMKALVECSGGKPACVVTFDPHPLETLGRTPPPFLSSFDQKCDILAGLGVHTVFALSFTAEFANTDHHSFAESLSLAMRPGCVVVGEDFRYGRGASGNTYTLKADGERFGFCAISVPQVSVNKVAVSSTVIRQLVTGGDLCGARDMLGRPYSVRGPVIFGDGRGRTLGFPTANVRARTGQVLPPNGVYAATTTLRGATYASVINLGQRPTFGPGETSMEVHIIGFEGYLYGETLDVGFVQFLRPETKFQCPADLSAQVRKDRDMSLDILTRKLGLVYNTNTL